MNKLHDTVRSLSLGVKSRQDTKAYTGFAFQRTLFVLSHNDDISRGESISGLFVTKSIPDRRKRYGY